MKKIMSLGLKHGRKLFPPECCVNDKDLIIKTHNWHAFCCFYINLIVSLYQTKTEWLLIHCAKEQTCSSSHVTIATVNPAGQGYACMRVTTC